MFNHLPRTASAFVVFSSLMAASSAHAAEGRALLDKFLAQPDVAKNKISWGTLTEQSADSFALTDVKIINERDEEMNIKTVAVQGLRESGESRVTFDTLAISGISGTTKKGGTFSVTGIAASAADFPVGIWKGGLTAEEKKQRVKLGSLSVSGTEVKDPKGGFTLAAIAMNGADIPLDWRYDPKQTFEGEPAAPMKLDIFSMSDFKASGDGNTVTIGSAAMKGANIPTSQDGDFNEWMQFVDSMSITGIGVSVGDTKVFSTDTMTVTMDDPQADGTINSKSVVDGMVVNLLALPDPKAKAAAQQLGYSEIRASMTGDGTYNPQTGRMAANNFNIRLQDMFDLAMDYTLTGYTAEIAQKVASMNQTMAQSVSPQQAFAAMIPELSMIKLEGLKIALTDRSLTGKLLDMQAAQMGTTGDQLAQGAPMMIGLGMGGLGMPEFTEMVTQAVGKFLQNKGSLIVEAKPAEPVAIMDVVLKGQADPTVVPGMLNLKVSGQ
ncbi:MAG: hypothetical protein ACR2PF_20875 [Rhizobiaceae bacterium]